MQKQITIVCGPTSTGKSDYVLELAKNSLSALIISADSRQFYKDIPIISGQDEVKSLPEGVTLVGQGFLSADSDFSISQFNIFYNEQINKYPDHNIFVVGGSGLYLKSISQSLETVTIPQDKTLRDRLNNLSLVSLQDELKKVNPEKFNLLNNSDVNNPRRLIRAIEIATYSQDIPVIPDLRSLSRVFTQENPENTKFTWLGLKKSKENLAEDIKKRVIKRIDLGAVEELKELRRKYPDQRLPIYSTIGISHLSQFIDGSVSAEEMIDLWTQSEISYAKRQMVWFKKQPQIVWYDRDI